MTPNQYDSSVKTTNHELTPKHQSGPLAALMLSFSAGIVADRLFATTFFPGSWLTLALVAAGGWWFGARRRKNVAWLILLAFFCAGAARHHEHWRYFSIQDVAVLDLRAGQPVAAHCRLLSVPEPSPLPVADPLATLPQGVHSTAYVEVLALRNRLNWAPASGRVAMRVEGHLLGYMVGDTVKVYGVLNRISGPMNPGERDRRVSERNRRTLCRLSVPHPDCVTVLSRDSTSLLALLGRVRSNGLLLLDRYVGPPRSKLAGALLLGARDRLGNEKVERFFHTGTIHLLAISGLHVGILAWSFFFLAKRTSWRRLILLLLMGGTVAYCHLTGLRAPVLRAAVLIQVVCLSHFWHREVSALNALSAAAMLVLFHRPGSIFLPGAQLSFLAVAVLIWISGNEVARTLDPVEKLVLESRSVVWRTLNTLWTAARRLALAGCAIWIVTLPLVMFWFHLCSPISLILNVLLTIPIVIALLSGFVVLLSGVICRPLASLSGWICGASLDWIEAIVHFSHDLPLAYFWVCGTSSIWCGAFYVVLFALLLFPQVHFSKRVVLAWFALWLTLPIMAHGSMRLIVPREPELRCTFLSVGHGTCAVLELPDNRVLIYDAGRMGMPTFGVSIVSEFLWSRRISHVDAVLMSHADADHYNLVPGLLDRFSVGEVLVTPRMFANPNPGVSVLRDAIQSAQIPVRELKTNDVLTFGNATARLLHPLVGGVNGSDNANSIVLEIQYQNRTMLLPGDLEPPGLEDVLAELPRDMDLVMAPHHGSLRSDPQAFMAWSTPEFVVISGGRDAKSEKAIEVFQADRARVFHTAFDGAVTVTICEHQLNAVSFLNK